MPDSRNASESRIEHKRHGCLTALLVVFGIFSTIAIFMNLFASAWIAGNIPDAPSWASTGIIIIGLLGIPALASLVAIWHWKKWGIYLYGIVLIIVFFLNLLLGMGIGTSLFGLLGAILIIGFASRQWSNFD